MRIFRSRPLLKYTLRRGVVATVGFIQLSFWWPFFEWPTCHLYTYWPENYFYSITLGFFDSKKSAVNFPQLIQVHFGQAHSQSQKTNLMTGNESHFFEQKDLEWRKFVISRFWFSIDNNFHNKHYRNDNSNHLHYMHVLMWHASPFNLRYHDYHHLRWLQMVHLDQTKNLDRVGSGLTL